MGHGQVSKKITLRSGVAGFASTLLRTLPDPGHPVPLAIAGNSDPIFDVMTDTAKPRIKAQITVDGRC